MKFDALTFTEKKNRIINAQTTPKNRTSNSPPPEGWPTAGVVLNIRSNHSNKGLSSRNFC